MVLFPFCHTSTDSFDKNGMIFSDQRFEWIENTELILHDHRDVFSCTAVYPSAASATGIDRCADDNTQIQQPRRLLPSHADNPGSSLQRSRIRIRAKRLAESHRDY